MLRMLSVRSRKSKEMVGATMSDLPPPRCPAGGPMKRWQWPGGRWARRSWPSAKRLLDVTLGVLALAVSAPCQILVSLSIRLCMGRPVLFRQVRTGLNGRPFMLVKFRTMTLQPSMRSSPLSDDERITGLGRFLRSTSLDELPTFFNVVRGDMSLVGPRPLPVSYVARYSPTQGRRMEVKPGVTGLVQIGGRNALDWDAKFALDVRYVDEHTLVGDIGILLWTALKVLQRDGVSAPGVETMPEFFGEPEPNTQQVNN